MQVALSSGVLGNVTRTSPSLTSRPIGQLAEYHSVIAGRTLSESGNLAITDTFEFSHKVKKNKVAPIRVGTLAITLSPQLLRENLITVGEKKSVPRTSH